MIHSLCPGQLLGSYAVLILKPALYLSGSRRPLNDVTNICLMYFILSLILSPGGELCMQCGFYSFGSHCPFLQIGVALGLL